MNLPKNPIQPLVIDEYGTVRFKANEVVRYLLDNGGIDMNQLARQNFNQDDREQFAELIGYSVSGWGDLSYVSDETYSKARIEADALYKSGNHMVNCMICEERIVDLANSTSCYSCSKVAHNNDKCSHLVNIKEVYYSGDTYCCDECAVFCDGCNKYVYRNEAHDSLKHGACK